MVRDPTAVRNRIGLAGQFAAVDEYLTGREAVEMVGRLYNLSARVARQRAAEVLERISLAADADRLVRTYSGGMKRRLDLAASLVGRPDVLFLDEPTTGIDPRSRVDVWALIRDLVSSGTTVLLTTQYLDEADRLADRIGVIHEGRLISEGTGNELKDRLGGAVIQVEVPEAAQAATRAALGADDGTDGTITLPAPAGSRSLADAIRRLDAAGMGFRPQTSFVSLVGGVLVAMAFAFALSWVMASLLGLAVKNSRGCPDRVVPAGVPAGVRNGFVSSVFVPTDTLPDWLRVFADHQTTSR